jgi:hypothetical protein
MGWNLVANWLPGMWIVATFPCASYISSERNAILMPPNPILLQTVPIILTLIGSYYKSEIRNSQPVLIFRRSRRIWSIFIWCSFRNVNRSALLNRPCHFFSYLWIHISTLYTFEILPIHNHIIIIIIMSWHLRAAIAMRTCWLLGNTVYALVICRVCTLIGIILLLVYEHSINPSIGPNPMSSH